MASWTINWKPSSKKELRKLPPDVQRRIIKSVEDLSVDPFPVGVRKMVGSEFNYRMRVGDYRVVYEAQSSRLIIFVIRVRHRKDAYR